MAESVGGIYLRLGLNLSELETGFVTASQTVAANISRLNRESNLIRIRSEVEIAGLDETADAERILQIRTDALNQQMAIQRDRVRILSAEYQNLTQAHGENSAQAQRAAIRLERERLALANLERDLRNLNDTQDESTSIFGEFGNMLPSIPTKLQAIGMAAGAVATGIGAASTAVKDLLEDFRELQKQSYELNMPVGETRDFLRQLRLGGGDIGDFEGYIRGITDAFVKGEYDDPEFVALRKYGAEITDASGRLKNFKDITDEVYQAWKKADEAGEGIEFLQLTGGESGIRDAIQLFKRYEEAKEDAAKVFKAEIDDAQLHELDRTFNLVEEQAQEFKNALGNLFVPAAQAAGEKFFQMLHDGTEYIEENKDDLQKWGFIASEVFSTVSEKLSELTSYQMPNTGDEKVGKMLDGMMWQQEAFNQQALWGDNSPWSKIFSKLPSDLFSGVIERAEEKQKAYNGTLEEATTVTGKVAQGLAALSDAQKENGDVLSQYGIQRVKEFKDELEDLQIELEFGDNDYQKSLAQLDLWRKRELTDKLQVSADEREAIEKLYAAKSAQIEQERADKISAIRKSVDAEFKTSIENQIDKIEEERQAWIKAGMDEAEATELAQKKIAKAYEEAAEKVQEHLRNAADIEYELTHTAFEKQIRDIEQWEELQKRKAESTEESAAIGAEAAAKEAQAFEQAMDRIRNKLQSLDDKIFEIDHSQYENDLRRIQQDYLREAEEFRAEGALTPEVQAKLDYYYQRQKFNLDQKASEARAKGSDYIKAPNGAMQWGGNAAIINADQIFGSGFTAQQQREIGLMADENHIRSNLLSKLDETAQAEVEKIRSAKELTSAQQDLISQTREMAAIPPTFQGTPVGSATVIQGEQVTQISPEDAVKVLEEQRRAQKVLSQAITEMPTQEISQFGEAVQQKASEIEQFDSLSNLATSTQQASDAQNAFATAVQNFPPDYFKNLADGTKSVSDSQSWLTKSTLELIDAQTALSNALKNLPTEQTENTASNDGYLKLSTSTQEVTDAQNLLARTSRETATSLEQITDIPPQKEIVQKDSGTKFGFDMDAAGLVAGMASLALAGATAPVSLPILGGVALTSLLAGLAKGTYDETTAAHEQANETLKPLAEVDLSGVITTLEKTDSDVQSVLQELQKNSESEIDFSSLITPLNSIDTTAQEILQTMATEKPEESDRLQELFGTLPNIEAGVGDILSALQSKEEPADTELDLSQLVTPLTSINENIQAAIQQMQGNKPYENDSLQELFGTLPNIGEDVKSILLAMQEEKADPVSEAQTPIDYLTPLNTINTNVQSVLTELQAKEPITFETLVTPLNTIQTAVGNILTALGNRQPPQITISPNNNVDLGGAYVFDNEMKQQLVNDITSEIVDNITTAVRQATSQSSYGYDA